MEAAELFNLKHLTPKPEPYAGVFIIFGFMLEFPSVVLMRHGCKWEVPNEPLAWGRRKSPRG